MKIVLVVHFTYNSRVRAVSYTHLGEALDNWLARNPQIQYITRDRGRCFREAINRMTPGVTQICDRFHLAENMTDTMIPEIEKMIRQTKQKPVSYTHLDVYKRQVVVNAPA